jgi:hypothetical protein
MPLTQDEVRKALDLDENELRSFSRVINRLLANTFLIYEFDHDEYYFLYHHERAARLYLDMMDWDLRHNEIDRVYQAVNRYGDNRRQLRLLESEFLAVLCLAYMERQEAGRSLARWPGITLDELRQKYITVVGKTDRLLPTNVRDALNTLRRYRLIEPIDGRALKPENTGQVIQLLPTLRMALNVDKLTDAEQLVKKYGQQANSTDGEPGEEVGEITEAGATD